MTREQGACNGQQLVKVSASMNGVTCFDELTGGWRATATFYFAKEGLYAVKWSGRRGSDLGPEHGPRPLGTLRGTCIQRAHTGGGRRWCGHHEHVPAPEQLQECGAGLVRGRAAARGHSSEAQCILLAVKGGGGEKATSNGHTPSGVLVVRLGAGQGVFRRIRHQWGRGEAAQNPLPPRLPQTPSPPSNSHSNEAKGGLKLSSFPCGSVGHWGPSPATFHLTPHLCCLSTHPLQLGTR